MADLQREFSVDYKRATGKPLPDNPDHFPPLKTGSMKHYLFPTEGVGADSHLLQLFEQAQKSIFIGTPYFIPPEKLIASLESALKRGVSVTILVPENSDHFIVKEASFRYLRRILSLGGTVCQFQNGFFHAKVLLIDEKVCDIGTANFDYRSLHLNHEINCFIYDKKFIVDVAAAISEDISLSSNVIHAQAHPGFLSPEAIERGCRLVENENRRSLENSARNRDALLLPARKLEPAFPDFRLVALRRNADQRIDLREPRSLLHFGVCRLPAAISDVVTDRIVEQHRILRDHPNGLTQRFFASLPRCPGCR